MKSIVSASVMGLCVAAALSACTVKGTQNNEGVMSKENVEKNVREFVYPLPTAFEVTEMLNRIEAPYILDICNASENVEKYITEAKRALNMGVYSADLCYASTYNQQNTVMEYTQTIRGLVDALDMTQAVDPQLASKMESNENNKEGLSELISNSFYDSYDYLNRNGRGPVSLMIVGGSWVEGLYIATHISDDTFDNKEMVKLVMGQKEPLEKLVQLLGQHSDDANLKALNEQLAPLAAIYSKMNESGLSVDEMVGIKKAVDDVREALVKP